MPDNISRAFTLTIFRMPCGKWGGKLIDDTGECNEPTVSNCSSPEEVQEAIQKIGISPSRVTVEAWLVKEGDRTPSYRYRSH